MSETNNNMARRALTWDELVIGYEKLKSDNADMLAALEAVQKAMSPINLGSCGFVTLSDQECQMLKPIIDAAIAKAKGGSNG